MTEQESINAIDKVLNSDYHYDESLGYQLTSDDFDWLHKAREALEFRIPKKPIEKKVGYFNKYTIHKCPVCGGEVSDTFRAFEHCPDCGQLLDWQE